jgi:hypothetical protein
MLGTPDLRRHHTAPGGILNDADQLSAPPRGGHDQISSQDAILWDLELADARGINPEPCLCGNRTLVRQSAQHELGG